MNRQLAADISHQRAVHVATRFQGSLSRPQKQDLKQAQNRNADYIFRAVSDPALATLLTRSARIDCDDEDAFVLGALARRVEDWSDLASKAEAHGLAPLLHQHLNRAGVRLPADTRRQLLALTIRHRRRNDIYSVVLGEILDAFSAAGIDTVVLKGAALAHVLYPAVGLRPMSDIDLLVDPRLTRRAQGLLAELGFAAPVRPTVRRLVGHHHLPPATKDVEGHAVQVEVHRDALSPDCFGSLTTKHVTGLRGFTLHGRRAYTLDHEDMLYHLCRHLAERSELLRLIWVADVEGYAARFSGEIDWERLARRYPFVLNTLSLLHLVNPLPHELARRPIPPPPITQGVGVGFKPLATTLRSDRLDEVWRDLLCPSDWWLRLYYGVNPTTSLFWYRWVRHPVHLGRWLARRAGIYGLWRAGSLS